MQAKGQAGSLVLVPRGTKPGTVINTPKGKVILSLATGPSSTPNSQTGPGKLEYLVTSENVELTLNKALASTESMAMLLRTLKEDLRPAKRPGINGNEEKAIKLEVAKKVRRALDAQVRTLNELHQFTKITAAPKVVQRPIQPAQVQSRSPGQNFGTKTGSYPSCTTKSKRCTRVSRYEYWTGGYPKWT